MSALSRTFSAVALVVMGASAVRAAYTWYVVDGLTAANGNWTQNGSPSYSSNGVTSGTAASLISTVTAPTYPNDYQVNANINLPVNVNGGNYGVMFRATSNAYMNSVAQGSFYLAEIQNPTWTNGACAATLALSKSVNGVFSGLYSGTTWCSTVFTLTATVNGAYIQLFLNGQYVMQTYDTSIATGQPGVNVRNAPSGAAMAWAILGPGDKTAPTPIDIHNLTFASYPTRVDMQWKGSTDDVNGSGIAVYRILRDGAPYSVFPYHLGEFSDNAVTGGVTHSYTVQVCDMFSNCAGTTFNVTTPPAGSVDPRQVGLRPTSTNWGGGGENINILSGNLNFTLPLLTAKARGGTSIGIALNYNSQNWRRESTTAWNYGRDLGYGYGVRLGAGSMQMFYNTNWVVDHWTFIDSTGAEYRLDKQVDPATGAASSTSGVWATSTDGGTFVFNSNTNQLFFPSGVYWLFGCSSRGMEGDETALYPTLIGDTNGNQLAIRYKPGVAGFDASGNNVYFGWPSSGRIDQIEDVRATPVGGGVYVTYQFNYTNDAGGVPHLDTITNNIGTAEGYQFTYSKGVALTSPWGDAFGTTAKLTGVAITIPGSSLGYTLTYDSADGYGSALTKVKFPYGGFIQWEYGDGAYSNSRTQREVMRRWAAPDGVNQGTAYTLNTITHDAANTMRQQVTLVDSGGVGKKSWTFNSSGATVGLVSRYQGIHSVAGTDTELQRVDSNWTMAGFGPVIASTVTTMDPGKAWATAKKVEQAIDSWGNLTSMSLYKYDGTLWRTYTNTYVTNTNYTSRYIHNRVFTSVVTEYTPTGQTTTPLATYLYDNYGGYSGYNNGAFSCAGYGMVSAYAPRQFDSGYSTSFVYRGNVTQMLAGGSVQTCMTQFDNTGNVIGTTDGYGVGSSATVNSNTNYAAPSAITSASLTSNFNYAADLLPTSAQGPNGDVTSTVYDSYARPSSTTSKTGAVTYFNYSSSVPAQVLAYTNGRVARTTLDGFGRTIKAESGTGTYSAGAIAFTAVLSVVDTQYAACGCSPLWKLSKTSRPYAPGGAVYWTVYTYDGIGRTTVVTAPDGSSNTGYVYTGADVKVTDAAGKAKTFTTDAAGNLTVVSEPNPAGGAALITNYSYDVLNRLRTVSMLRGSTTQTRSFVYTGALLTSVTNPENGTVTNYYNTDNSLAYKIDAKGQKIAFSYDSYKRVVQISKYPNGVNEDVCQRVNYYFDTNPDDPAYTQYSAGRLTAIHYGGANCTYTPSQFQQTTGNNYIEMFSYTQAGDITNKKLRLWKKTGTGSNPTTVQADLEAVYTYTNEGKINTLKYPLGTTYQFTYDGMGRPTKMTDTQTSTDLVGTVTYGPAGELLSMGGAAVSETRQYNAMGQLTQLNGTGVAIKYNYAAAGSNNGQIASQQDLISGETITYQYDSLKRLASATSSQGWNQNFGYDGFGNLISKTGSGTAPVGSYPADPATNRLTGTLYDANGNQTGMQGSTGPQMSYDVSNRMTGAFGVQLGQGAAFEYDIGNQRIYQSKQTYNGSGWVQQSEEWYFYGITGQKLGTYRATLAGTTLSWSVVSAQVFFGPKLISGASGAVQEDIRGSIGSYFAYGEDRSGALGNDAVRFATYTRDSMTGLDYASQRYHLPGLGRFAGVDPFGGSARAGDPGSWNRFAYVDGDPIDLVDPTGQYEYIGNQTPFNILLLTPGQLCAQNAFPGCYCAAINAIANMLLGKGPNTGDARSLLDGIEKRQAADAFRYLSHACQSWLTNHGIDLSTAQGRVAGTTFLSVYVDGSTLVTSFVPGAYGVSSGTTIANYLSPGNAAQVIPTATNTPSTFVVLGSAYFAAGATEQNGVLVHEVLHVATGLLDSQLAALMGLGRFSTDALGEAAASASISYFLGIANCAPPK